MHDYVALYRINDRIDVITKKLDKIKEEFGNYGVKLVQERVIEKQKFLDSCYKEFLNFQEDYLEDEFSVDNMINVIWTLRQEEFFKLFLILFASDSIDKSELCQFLEKFIFEEHKKYLFENVSDFMEEIKYLMYYGLKEAMTEVMEKMGDYNIYAHGIDEIFSVILNSKEDTCFIFNGVTEFFDVLSASNSNFIIDEILPAINVQTELMVMIEGH